MVASWWRSPSVAAPMAAFTRCSGRGSTSTAEYCGLRLASGDDLPKQFRNLTPDRARHWCSLAASLTESWTLHGWRQVIAIGSRPSRPQTAIEGPASGWGSILRGRHVWSVGDGGTRLGGDREGQRGPADSGLRSDCGRRLNPSRRNTGIRRLHSEVETAGFAQPRSRDAPGPVYDLEGRRTYCTRSGSSVLKWCACDAAGRWATFGHEYELTQLSILPDESLKRTAGARS